MAIIPAIFVVLGGSPAIRTITYNFKTPSNRNDSTMLRSANRGGKATTPPWSMGGLAEVLQEAAPIATSKFDLQILLPKRR